MNFNINRKYLIFFLIHLFFIISFAVIYESGIFYASGDYYNFAKIMAGEMSEVLSTQTTSLRTFGYPLFLLITGVLSTDQYSSVLAFQLFINLIFIPTSIYFLYRKNKHLALFISIGLIFTFQPYLFVRSLLSEYLFALSLIFLIVETLKIKKLNLNSLILPTIWAIVATSSRSTGIIILPLFIVVYTLFNHQELKKGVISLVSISIILLSSTQITSLILPSHSSGFGIMSFMNLVMTSSKFSHIMEVKTETSKEVFSTLDKEFSENFKKYSEILSKKDKNKYLLKQSSPETIVNYGLRRPTLEFYWQSKWAMIRGHGPKKADKILTTFFFDNLKKRPKPILKQIAYNTFRYTIMSPFEYTRHSSDTNKIKKKVTQKDFRVWASLNSISQIKNKYKRTYGEKQSSFWLIGSTIPKSSNFSQSFKETFKRILNFNIRFIASLGLLTFFINTLFFLFYNNKFKDYNISLFAMLVILGHAVIVGIAHPPISRYLSPVAFLYILMIGNLYQNKRLLLNFLKKLKRTNV